MSTLRTHGPPRRWWLGLSVLGLAMACVTSSRMTEPAGAPSARVAPAPAPKPKPELEPAPLVEIDPDAVAAAEPEPEPEPLPFDDEQLARIYSVQDIVAAAAVAHGVEPALINALIWVESKFERRARGPAGAQGLMQLMPKTAGAMAKQLGRKRKSYDPDFNIHAGTLLLARLLDRFDGDVGLALAGYNRGGGTVSKWVANQDPLPEGVVKFVDRVLRAKLWFDRLPPESTPKSTPESGDTSSSPARAVELDRTPGPGTSPKPVSTP